MLYSFIFSCFILVFHVYFYRGRKTNHHLAFSLTLEGMSSLDFIAPDEKIFDYWTDGINALLGKLISEENANVDLKCFDF